MKPTLILLVLSLVVSAYAGEIHGKITTGSQPVPKGTKVEVEINGQKKAAVTDESGAYRIIIPTKGVGEIRVHRGKDQVLKTNVASYDKPVRYNLAIVNDKLVRR